MTVFVVAIHITVCFVLILVILLQAGRGSGLSWGVFGGSPQSLLGTKSASFLAKATSFCAILFLFTCIGLNVLETRKSRSLFQAGNPAQVDVNKLKDVLDKIKSGKAEAPKDSAQSELPLPEAVKAATPEKTADAPTPATPAT